MLLALDRSGELQVRVPDWRGVCQVESVVVDDVSNRTNVAFSRFVVKQFARDVGIGARYQVRLVHSRESRWSYQRLVGARTSIADLLLMLVCRASYGCSSHTVFTKSHPHDEMVPATMLPTRGFRILRVLLALGLYINENSCVRLDESEVKALEWDGFTRSLAASPSHSSWTMSSSLPWLVSACGRTNCLRGCYHAAAAWVDYFLISDLSSSLHQPQLSNLIMCCTLLSTRVAALFSLVVMGSRGWY